MTVTVALAATVGGCKSPPPPPPKPLMAKIVINAAADANPDSQGRASPVVIRLYKLKDDEAFKGSDFFAVFDREQATLQAALIGREEFELAPSQTRTLQEELPLDVKYVAVVAAFRDIRTARWRDQALVPVRPPAKKKPTQETVNIGVGIQRASVTIGFN